jgi:hypothetical protein
MCGVCPGTWHNPENVSVTSMNECSAPDTTSIVVPGAPLHFEIWLMFNGKQGDYKMILEVLFD